MSNIAYVNSLSSSHKTSNVFGTLQILAGRSLLQFFKVAYKAVSDSSNLLVALFLEVFDRLCNDGIHSFPSMRVISITSLGQPFHDVEACGSVERNGVAVEQIWDQGEVSIGSKLIHH